MRPFLSYLVGWVFGNLLFLAWVFLRVRGEPRIQPPSPPAKPAVFHIEPPLMHWDGRKWQHCTKVWADSPSDAVEGILLAAHGE